MDQMRGKENVEHVVYLILITRYSQLFPSKCKEVITVYKLHKIASFNVSWFLSQHISHTGRDE